jgi:hypothetical protein
MPADRGRSDKRTRWRLDQVTKSEFFHQKLHEYGLLEVAYAVERIQGEKLDWDLDSLGISEVAWNKIIHQGIKPVRVFAHPYILTTIPRSVGYYRGLAMVSLKSMNNIGLPIERHEKGDGKTPIGEQRARQVAFRLNELISRLIEEDEQIDPREFDLWRGMTAGSTAQGSWQNRKGDIAEDLVKGMVQRHVRESGLVHREESDGARCHLVDGRTIVFGSEPDIALYDASGQILVAVEIKGGIDKAGVLERIGAALKSLSRAKQGSERAITILIVYRVSLTEQGENELKAHRGDIDYWMTIEDVLDRAEARERIFNLMAL